MAITEEKKLIQTEIVGDYKIIQVAYDIIYKKDGVETMRKRWRNSFQPDADVSGEDQEIKDLADLYWTDELKALWQTKVENDNKLGKDR
jgi:hypothetical protein|tara:strand:+ start:596 stop:862 length:267 start_codon:yes stop_codon:yes gene_type:complete